MTNEKLLERLSGLVVNAEMYLSRDKYSEIMYLYDCKLIEKMFAVLDLDTSVLFDSMDMTFTDFQDKITIGYVGESKALRKLKDYSELPGTSLVFTTKVKSALSGALGRVNKLWLLNNSYSFEVLLNTASLSYRPTEKVMKELFSLPVSDFIFDFRTDNFGTTFSAGLSKCEYTINIRGIEYNALYFVIEHSDDNKISKVCEMNIIPEFYPRLFATSNFSECNTCKNSSKCTKVSCNVTERGESVDNNIRLVGEKKRLDNFCPQCTLCKSTVFTFDDVLNATMYALDRFINRKKVVKLAKPTNLLVAPPRSKSISSDKLGGIVKDTYLSLKDYVVYERSERRSLGGTHASPKEHIRRGYIRHYKSGRTVEVSSVVVNKGKEKVSYSVN